MPAFMYSRVTSKSPPSFCVTNFSTRFTNITVLLKLSCDCSYCVSRTILAPQPGLTNLPELDAGEFVKIILLYTFVCLSASHFFLLNHCHSEISFPLIVWFGGYFMLNIECVLCANLELNVLTCPDLPCFLSCTASDVHNLVMYLSI
jgi:hypothetical protein